MKQTVLFLSFVMCIYSSVYPQANGSFFTLQLGQKTCLFKYEERLDSIMIEVDKKYRKDKGVEEVTQINPVTLKEKTVFMKDTVVIKKSLTLQDGNSKSIHTKRAAAIDTVIIFDTATLAEYGKVIDPAYHIETEMSYFDFLLLLKSKFELKNPQKKLHVYSFNIYYETADTGGLIRIKYPQTIKGVISRLNCLANGGFVLLSLKAADHDLVGIDTQGSFLALIHIRK